MKHLLHYILLLAALLGYFNALADNNLYTKEGNHYLTMGKDSSIVKLVVDQRPLYAQTDSKDKLYQLSTDIQTIKRESDNSIAIHYNKRGGVHHLVCTGATIVRINTTQDKNVLSASQTIQSLELDPKGKKISIQIENEKGVTIFERTYTIYPKLYCELNYFDKNNISHTVTLDSTTLFPTPIDSSKTMSLTIIDSEGKKHDFKGFALKYTFYDKFCLGEGGEYSPCEDLVSYCTGAIINYDIKQRIFQKGKIFKINHLFFYMEGNSYAKYFTIHSDFQSWPLESGGK